MKNTFFGGCSFDCVLDLGLECTLAFWSEDDIVEIDYFSGIETDTTRF